MSHHEVVAHVAPRTTWEVLRRRQGAKLAGRKKKNQFDLNVKDGRIAFHVLFNGKVLTLPNTFCEIFTGWAPLTNLKR